MNRAESYSEIVREVDELIGRHVENDPTVAAYLIARAALIEVRATRGPKNAAELAYKIADELATEVV